MKLFTILVLNFLLLSHPLNAERILTKLEILNKSQACLKDSKKQVCKKLILQLERFQLNEFEQNRFKCQSSILGLQTELVEAHFFGSDLIFHNGIMIPYVIKNC